jgi:hypothetical protein
MNEPSHTAHRTAKDLSRERPRPMDARLGGYPWLPRMIDKARAARAGTLGSYYRYPCPIDAACLELLGINAVAFREIACQVLNERDVVCELSRAGAEVDALLSFDPVRLNAELHSHDP